MKKETFEEVHMPDMSGLLGAYENKWVALSPDYTRVLASGDTLRETDAQVPEHSRNDAVFYKVLPQNAYYAPSIV